MTEPSFNKVAGPGLMDKEMYPYWLIDREKETNSGKDHNLRGASRGYSDINILLK